jgi:shikimate dehydrogenase
MRTPTARTRVFAVLGDPVAHSLSPLIQNAAFLAAGVDGTYVGLRARASEVAGLARGLALAGGGGNVTLPHKQQALKAADDLTAIARRTGVANTFWSEGGRVVADNTDVQGFRHALEALWPGAPAGLRVLLLGAGGAARAVACGLLDGGAGEVTLLNRTPGRAVALAASLGDRRMVVASDPAAVRDSAPDLVVNATRLGLDPADALPVALEALGGTGAVLDVVYTADGEGTPLVKVARGLDIPAQDGREMLLRQGAAAFERWWQVEAPLEAMRAALAGQLVG